MLTSAFYQSLASMLAGDATLPGTLFIAVGAVDGDADEPDRSATHLAAELARRPAETVEFVDNAGSVSRDPTTRVRFTSRFSPGSDLGEVRECGLFGGDASERPDSGTLFSCFRHEPITVTAGSALDRSIVVDLAPRPLAPGMVPTRWLGNVTSREIHDMEHLTGVCQVAEIRIDNRFYFADVDEARGMGYDPCAFCFGRDQSER